MNQKTFRLLLAAAFFALICCTKAEAGSIPTLMQSATASSSASMFTFGPSVTLTALSGTQHGTGTYVTGVTGTGGGPVIGSRMWVTHTLGKSVDVTFQWRTRTLNETFASEGGTPSSPPLNLAVGDYGLSGDIFDITGFAPGEAFVVFSDFVVPKDSSGTPAFDLASNAADGSIHIATLDTVSGMWVNTVVLNHNADQNAIIDYQGSWEDAGSPMTVGSWGVDVEHMIAWSVVDHNSQFAVAPEPSTAALMAGCAACCAIGGIFRRRKALPL